MISVTDPRGLVSTTGYYADNKVQDVRDGAGNDTHYVYDLGGRAISVCSPSCMAGDATNPSKIPTTYQYFKDNLLQWSRQPFKGDGSVLYQTTYGYDQAGMKLSQDMATVNSSGGIISDPGAQTFAYYNDDRLHTQTGRAGSGTITDAYDPAGNIKTATDNTGTDGGSTITSTFYLDSKPRTVNNGVKTNQYCYDGAGQTVARTDITDSGGGTAATTTYSYGDAGLATSMYASAASGTTSYHYNVLGQPTQENDPNGQYTLYNYNADNSLGSKVLRNSSNAVINSWTYQYDADGHIVQQLTPSLNSYYWYDDANRLCYYSTSAAQSSCSPATYTYDHDGNRLTAPGLSFTYNADDSMNNVNSGPAFSYTPYQAMASDGSTSFGYDGLGRMNSAGGTNYQSDAFDRQRSVGSTTIHYDGFSQTPAIESTGSTDKVYALDPFGRPKAVQNGSATPEYLTDDGHGNIANVTGNTQAVTCSVQYDPWGNPISGQGTGNPCQSGSTSGDVFYRSARRDPNTGNYQFGYRTYDPTKAGFLSSDVYRAGSPEQNQGLQLDPLTADRYNYVNGDPINLVDPSGHKFCRPNDPTDDCDAYRGQPLSADEVRQKNEAIGRKQRAELSHSKYQGAQFSERTYQITPQPGHGQVRFDYFIMDSNPCALGDKGDKGGWGALCGLGDARAFGDDPNCVHSRVCISVDYNSGQVTVIAAPSCSGPGKKFTCKSALPINNGAFPRGNDVDVDQGRTKDLKDVTRIRSSFNEANFSHPPFSFPGAISDVTYIRPTGKSGVSVYLEGDAYPSLEVFHDRDNGETVLLAQARETVIFALALPGTGRVIDAQDR